MSENQQIVTDQKSLQIQICLDATMLDTFVACPAKFNYRFNLNKSTLNKAPALDKGSLEHVGFEAYYKQLQKREPFSVALDAGVEAVNIYSATESDLDPEEVSTMKTALIENLTYWKETDRNLEILEVEAPFAYELFSDELIRILMIGKIDLIVQDTKLGRTPYDHKTYSRAFPVHRKTNQFCNYAYAVQSNYLIVNRCGLQKSLKPEEKHKRVPLSYDEPFLQQWRANVVKWCYWYLDCVTADSWPLNDTSCDKYNRLCEYYNVCDSSGAEAKTYKLNVDFRDSEKWDVASSLGLQKDKND